MTHMVTDCTHCGICCVNPNDNQREHCHQWVEVMSSDVILKRKDLVSKYVDRESPDRAHLRMDGGGRCLALQGQIGERVSCRIYSQRPRACHRVQLGNPECLALRAARMALIRSRS